MIEGNKHTAVTVIILLKEIKNKEDRKKRNNHSNSIEKRLFVSVLSNEKVAAIFNVIGQSATQCSSICMRAYILFHRLFVLLLYAFTIPAAAASFSLRRHRRLCRSP